MPSRRNFVAKVDDSPEKREELQLRAVGAIGGVHKAPYSRKANITDVTAACLHTLIDVCHNTVVQSDTGLAVFLHLDYQDESIMVRSERNDDAARVTITARTGEDLLVRIPRWMPTESVLITDNGEPVAPSRVGDFAPLAGSVPRKILVEYDLSERQTTEVIDTVEYEFMWRGDGIVGICPNDDRLPLYPTSIGCNEEESRWNR